MGFEVAAHPILFPPPHSPVGLRWTPPDSVSKVVSERGGLIFRWSPVDSTGLHRTIAHKIYKTAKYTVRWTPLDSTGLQHIKFIKQLSTQSTGLHWTEACKITEMLSAQSGGVHWSPLD